MELFTLDRKFLKQNVLDKFESAIWTERYYGNGEFELVVPATAEMLGKLPIGVFVGMDDSKEVMMLDTVDLEEGNLKVTGSSLLSFLNNRILRSTNKHEDRYWTLTKRYPGQVLSDIIQNTCISGPFLSGSTPINIPNTKSFIIPGLSVSHSDTSGSQITVAIPFGPVFDAMYDVATTYEVGMKITLESATDTAYSLKFMSYKGIDRTSKQTTNPIVRFSPQMDTLTGIKELQSIADYKTIVYSFAPENPNGLATTAGTSHVSGSPTGFDLRVMITFEEDITTDQVGNSASTLLSILNARAAAALNDNRFIKTVDGEVVALHQFQYGSDYSLGDIIEVQGNTGVVQSSRVTEYIRSQDDAGETAYPTVAMLD